jgi:hypothetical protein
MKVRIIGRAHQLRGSGVYPIGGIVELDNAAAARLIALGSAELADEPAPVVEIPPPPPLPLEPEPPHAEPENKHDRGPLGVVDANVSKTSPRPHTPKRKP